MSRPRFDALEDFAGPGGWDEGARLLGLHFYGVDYDKAACETARAAGHHREQADVTEHASPEWARGLGHVSSPSCTLFSMAGSGIGRLVLDVLARAVKSILAGEEPAAVRDVARGAIYPVALAEAEAKNAKRKPEKRWPQEKVEAKARLDAKVAALVLEPARRIVELEPTWIALEQVPEVMPIWQAYQTVLSNRGWSVWTGVLNAADYGVPQTRKRAILIASRVRPVAPPVPTHSRDGDDGDLFGGSRRKWVSMAAALGWGFDHEPSATVCGGGADTGGAEPFGNQGYRKRLAAFVAAGATGEGRPKDPYEQPADTLTGKGTAYWMGDVRSKNGCVRPVTEPAPTLTSSMDNGNFQWVHERPATTVVGSFKPESISPPGCRTSTSRQNAEGGVRVTVAEGGVLQSFPADYPWQGSRTKQYQQVGNAIPPLLAAHVLAAVTGLTLGEVAA